MSQTAPAVAIPPLVNQQALAHFFDQLRIEVREEGITDTAEIDNIATERLQAMVSRVIAQYADRRHWQDADTVNRAHFPG